MAIVDKDFNLKWYKRLGVRINLPLTAEVSEYDNLTSFDIQTRIAGKSFKILNNNQQIAVFEIEDISSIDYFNTNVFIYTGNLKIAILSFVNLFEANLAISKLETIMNGGTV